MYYSVIMCVTQAVMVHSCVCLALQAIIAIILYGIGCNVCVCNKSLKSNMGTSAGFQTYL